MKIALIDKVQSRNDYKKYFDFEFDEFHMSSIPITKLLKKDVDLVVNLDKYDFVILVGSEAGKEYAKVTSVTNMAGQLVLDKFICITNPAMLIFKPEGKNEFDKSIDRVHKIIAGELTNSAKSGNFEGINNSALALDVLKEVLASNVVYVALDTETTALYPRNGYVLGLSISYKLNHGRYIVTDILDSEHTDLLQQIIDKYEIVFHNMKFDYKMIKYHLGLKFRNKHLHDTMLLHYVLDENSAHGLKPLSLKYTNYGDYDAELDMFKKSYCFKHKIKEDQFTYDLIPYDIISKYASIDTAATLELFFKFWKVVEANPKLLWVYKNLLIRGSIFLMNVEEVGIPICKERMSAAGNYLDKWISEARSEIYTYQEVKDFERDKGDIFNPNSPLQLRKLLFDYAKLTPTGKLTKTKAISTDAEVLKELSSEHALPGAILKVRKLSKLQNTYINKILPELDLDERVRTNFNLHFTSSGRLSSSGKFNAQQIVRDDPIIKGCIKAPKGYVVVSQDLQTAEMYFAAVLSGDKNLMQVFSSGGDFHSQIAKMVFNLPCEVEDVKKVYPLLRQSAKAISFGILFGSGPAKVAESVSKGTGEYYSLEQAKEDIDTYFTKFSALKKWLAARKKEIEKNGYVYSHFGRKRRLLNVFSADKGIASHEVRSGINMLIQSVSSDVNLLAAMNAQDECNSKNIDAKIFMLVHDSIVALVKVEDVEAYTEVLARCTKEDHGCSIKGFPIGIDVEIYEDYSFGKFEKVYSIENNCLVRIADSTAKVVPDIDLDEEDDESD